MSELSALIAKKLLKELDLPSYPLGTELDKAVFGSQGIPYFRMLFSIPGMQDRILNLVPEIKDCNLRYKEDPNCTCVDEIRQKRKEIWDDVVAAGLFINWDILDNLWDKLPGD